MDERWYKLGNLIVNYSLSIKPNENVMIAMTEIETYPLVIAVYEACIRVGAFPQVQFLSEELNRVLLKHGSSTQINTIPGIEEVGMDWADVYIGLRGAHNLDVFWDIPAKKLSDFRKTMGTISNLRWEKTRWCLLRVPNSALAFQAGVDEKTTTDMFFNACFLDWKNLKNEWQRIAEVLNKGDEVHIIAHKTDLRFSIKNRKWEVACGKINMPDGEIETSPVEETIDGTIYFELPGVLGGRLINNICLSWKEGKLISASSTTNQKFLENIVSTDKGASIIGEFAFGLNPKLEHFTKDILLDEKIGGTIHIALGRAYPVTGGTNKSSIHWDIIKDMRKDGKIFLDNQLIYEKGKFLI